MTRPMRHLVVLAALLTGLSVVTACGQKGPLFLPDKTENASDKDENTASQGHEETKKGRSGSGY